MKKEVSVVASYWEMQARHFIIDPEVLTDAVCALSAEERNVLLRGDSIEPSEHKEYLLVQLKAFNRHNDICDGVTDIDSDGNVAISIDSSVTELDLDYDTIEDCNKNMLYKISDIEKDVLPSLSFETIASVTGAIIRAGITEC